MSNSMMCWRLVQNGAEAVSNNSKRKAPKRKCFGARILANEAEGARTLNLRIDSLSEAFVSICQ